ncbi:MAG: orotidine-5'-phosphate decarboxylase [Actinomycetota bacterium]
MTNAQTGLIVALDHTSLTEAEELARQLEGGVDAFKVGLTLFAGYGPEAVRRIRQYGPVFCDLKLHDIPHQVGLAAGKLAELGCWMLTVHASGGRQMIRSAVNAAAEVEAPPIVAAVTTLTSLSSADLAELGQGSNVADQVVRLAGVAVGAGARAVVCSPLEIEILLREFGDQLKLVVPGIRPAGAKREDQSRTMSPAEAAKSGAGYVVVGRPITGSEDPVAAAILIIEEMRLARLPV